MKDLKPMSGSKILIAVSGGMDSCVLLKLLVEIRQHLQLELCIGHVHHGPGSQYSAYREDAQSFVSQLAQYYELSFFTSLCRPLHEMPDEDSLRRFRYKALEALREETQSHWIALGHHKDDLLETRMIRLIRGVGKSGIKAMSLCSQKKLRPLLSVNKNKLEIVAHSLDLKYIEDPSNEDTKFLRNWLRKVWLPQLEAHRQGSLASLGRSLDQLARTPEFQRTLLMCFSKNHLIRARLLSLSHVEQRQVLAKYLVNCRVENYSASQIDEVLKRLRSNRKDFAFKVAGRVWKVHLNQVTVCESS